MYLVHFNGNHSKRNGQFVNGDGDNDGIIDDHHNYSRNKKDLSSNSNKSYVHPADVKDAAELAGTLVKTGANLYFNFSKTGRFIKGEASSLLNSGGFLKAGRQAARDVGTYDLVNRYKNIAYIKIADAMNRR